MTVNNIKYLIAVVALCAVSICCNAQNNRKYKAENAGNILKANSEPGWYYFREEKQVHEAEVFKQYAAVFGLTSNDEMRLEKKVTDRAGFTHSKYRQYYRGIPVEGSMMIIHSRRGNIVYLVNGNIIRNITLPSYPTITETDALQKALSFLPSSKYLWLMPAFEKMKQQQENNPAATFFPKGKLCIYPATRNEELLTTDYSLGWMFDIYINEPGKSKKIFVDALDRTIKNSYKLGYECNPGTAGTTFNGNQTIYTKFNTATNSYNLINDCQTNTLHTIDLINDSLTANGLEFSSSANTWSGIALRSPGQTQFGIQSTYNYYNTYHERTSWDGTASSTMTAYHGTYGSSYANACWGCFGNAANFGIGPSGVQDTDDWNSLDIVGHEFTHGVFQDEAGNAYYAEIGGLNESFADIFGEMIEQTTEGTNETNSSWLVAEDRGAIRSFWNPKQGGQPDTYRGINWFNTDTCTGQAAGDNCGVHTNSGVQNHWFYFLAKGGNGRNDNLDTFTVTGITNIKARDIAYRSLVYYITPSSKYIDARNGAIQAAEDLYGVCSNEAIQTAISWYAVGGDLLHPLYVSALSCANVSTAGAVYEKAAIRSLIVNASGGGCSGTSMSATNGNIVLKAGRDVSVVGLNAPVVFSATGSSSVTIKQDNCSFTLH